jgi:hypothetical protein
MHLSSKSSTIRVSCHWQARAVETERQLSGVSCGQLRAVYSELLDHYRRMASLHDAGATRVNRS